MSWSVIGSGELKATAAKLEQDFKSITTLTGAEKGIKDSAAKLVADVLAAYTGGNVGVSASGHAGVNGATHYQNLDISIKPIV